LLVAMSGFERSAPIPGSQGPRRSQMVRYNNAPPPLTPWRAEVLEAQKQIEAAKKGERTSRSRSRSKSRRRGKGAGGPAPVGETSSSRIKNAAATLAPETGVVLRQARERGEGWYAAVARAAESWESVSSHRRRPPQPGKVGKVDEAAPEGNKLLAKSDKRGKAKDRPPEKEETEAEKQRREEKEEKARQEEQRLEQEREEQRAREEYEARAEERRLKAEEEKRRAEEERARMEVLKKQRQEKLKGAFAVGQDDDEEEDREAELVRRAAEKKKQEIVDSAGRAPIVAGGALAPQVAAPSTALMPRSTPRQVDPELSEKLRFEPGLDPAEAFMRLQERKRKGRRAEFGGPPRGCSPWRDGRRGISWQKSEGSTT